MNLTRTKYSLSAFNREWSKRSGTRNLVRGGMDFMLASVPPAIS